MNTLIDRRLFNSVRVIATLWCTLFFATDAVAQDLQIDNYSLVGKARISRVDFEYTYTAQAINTGPDYQNVRGSLSSASPHTTVVDGDLLFGTVASGKTVTSLDTFTIRQNRRYPIDWSDLNWEIGFDLPTPVPDGVLLEGNPGDLAMTAVVDMHPTPVDDSQILDGVILSRLTVMIARDATIGEVNQALSQVDARITTMRLGSNVMSLAIPKEATIGAITQVANQLATLPAILFAFPAEIPSPAILPPGHTEPTHLRDKIQHLMPTRFPAAWNAAGLIELDVNGDCVRPVTVLVADLWYKTATHPESRAYEDAAVDQLLLERGELIYADPRQADAPVPPLVANYHVGFHGYDVMSTMAARFDAEPPTGAMPLSECFDYVPIPTNGYSWNDKLWIIRHHFPEKGSGKFLINVSQEFGWDKSKNLTPANIGLLTSPLKRAILAKEWRFLTIDREDDFLVIVSAGNGGDKPLANFYPGVSRAAFSSPFSVASRGGALLHFATDVGLWGGSGEYRDLSATAFQMQVLEADLAVSQPRLDRELNNVLVVGSTSNQESPDDLVESAFSDRGADVYAVGEEIPNLPSNRTIQGTSFSAPQVTGLAAYLWLIAPELRHDDLPASVTRYLIDHSVNWLGTIHGDDINLIDAYRAALTFDLDPDLIGVPAIQFGEAPVREAILDIDGDDYFEEDDLKRYLWAYYDGDFLDPDTSLREPSPPRTYSRFDLNGDGFTGGSLGGCDGTIEDHPGCTWNFDLDLLASPELTPVYNANILQSILLPPGANGALEQTFNENTLTDFEILCYYAFSPLYYGDLVGTNTLEGLTWLSDCVDIETTIDIPISDIHMSSTVQLTAQIQEPGGPVVNDSSENNAWEYFRWSSSDPNVAIVDPLGRMHVAGSGTTTIRASYGRSATSSTITVPFETPISHSIQYDNDWVWDAVDETCYPGPGDDGGFHYIWNPGDGWSFVFKGAVLPSGTTVADVNDPAIVYARMTEGGLPPTGWIYDPEAGDLIMSPSGEIGDGFSLIDVHSIGHDGNGCPYASYEVHFYKPHVATTFWRLWKLSSKATLPYAGGTDETLWVHITPPVPLELDDAGEIDVNTTSSGAALMIEIAETSFPNAVNLEAVAPWTILSLPALNPVDERDNIVVTLQLDDVAYEIDIDLTVNEFNEERNLVVNKLAGWHCGQGGEGWCPGIYDADIGAVTQ